MDRTARPDGVPDFDGLAEQLSTRMGITITEWNPARVVATMPVAGNRQPYGLLHGGANAALAETAGSTCAALAVGPGRIALGLELSCTHHRAARDGTITAVATPAHIGRGTATVEILLTDDAGRRTCTARLTCVVRDQPPASAPGD